MTYVTCPTCIEYGERRVDVMPSAIVAAARRHRVVAVDLFDRYMTGVHDRHLSGLSLAAP